MRRLTATAVVLSLILLGATACSGDSSPSLEDWQAEVDALCATEPDPDLEFTAESFRTARAEFVPYLEEIRDVGVPEERAEDVERVHELLDRQIELIDEVIEVIEADGGLDDTADILAEARDLDAELDELAMDLGVPSCVDEDDPAGDTPFPEEIPAEISASDLSAAEQLFATGLTAEGLTPTEAICVSGGLFAAVDGDELEQRLFAGENADDLIDPVIGGVVTECLTAERLLELDDR